MYLTGDACAGRTRPARVDRKRVGIYLASRCRWRSLLVQSKKRRRINFPGLPVSSNRREAVENLRQRQRRGALTDTLGAGENEAGWQGLASNGPGNEREQVPVTGDVTKRHDA